jgi:hypothetical protein
LKLPNILSEEETLQRALAGASLSRFGDGELRLASRTGTSPTQVGDKNLARELCSILRSPPENCLACLPRFDRGPKKENWAKYIMPRYAALYVAKEYGSAFISRPDSAPWIDTESYWLSVSDLWKDRRVTFVAGTDRSLRDEDFADAASVRRVEAPRRDAYAEIDRIEEEIGIPSGPVILCLGATATVLAARLARKGVHALDLGHVGMFRRSAGAYRYSLDDLASPGYRAQLAAMHAQTKGWGADGAKHEKRVRKFAEELGTSAILDYGCGRETLKKALGDGFKVEGFDVGIPGKDVLPKPAGLVVVTDVAEHLEPKKLDNVLNHIHRLAEKGIYFVIATRPANATLPGGKNAHLQVKPAEWWIERIFQLDVAERRSEVVGTHEVRIWLRK